MDLNDDRPMYIMTREHMEKLDGAIMEIQNILCHIFDAYELKNWRLVERNSFAQRYINLSTKTKSTDKTDS